MNDEEVQVFKQSCELAISLFISRIAADFKSKTNRGISSITIPMIDVTSMGSLPKTKYVPGQCLIALTEEKKAVYPSQTWFCCGGIELDYDEKCPVCGDSYE